MLMAIGDSDFRTWGLAVFAFFIAVIAMMLLNGSPREFFFVMILLGYMAGMMRNPQRNAGGETDRIAARKPRPNPMPRVRPVRYDLLRS